MWIGRLQLEYSSKKYRVVSHRRVIACAQVMLLYVPSVLSTTRSVDNPQAALKNAEYRKSHALPMR